MHFQNFKFIVHILGSTGAAALTPVRKPENWQKNSGFVGPANLTKHSQKIHVCIVFSI